MESLRNSPRLPRKMAGLAVSIQTQAEHAIIKGLIDKYIMNIHTGASDTGLEELPLNKVQHMPSKQK